MLVVALMLVACGSNGGDSGSDTLVDVVEVQEVGGDVVGVDGLDTDAAETSDVEAEETIPETTALTLPFEPVPVVEAYVDAPFVQETNHTSNEVLSSVGGLVGVVTSPPSFQAHERWPADVIQATPAGLVWFDEEGEPAILELTDEPLLALARGSDSLLVQSETKLFLVTVGDSVEAVVTTMMPPDGLLEETVHGLVSGSWPMALAQSGVWVFPAADISWTVPAPNEPSAVLEHEGTLIVAHAGGLVAYDIPAEGPPSEAIWSLDGSEPESDYQAIFPLRAMVSEVLLPASLDLVLIGDGGVRGYAFGDGSGQPPILVDEPAFAGGRVPLDQPRAASRTSDGGFVVATAGGAYRVMDRGHGPEWRVYNRERWLPSEQVHAVATDPTVPDGPIWFATSNGLARVTAERVSLEEKLVPFVERIVLRHNREGAVADSKLAVKGDLSTNIPWDSDNDGGWTCYWVLSECYRWKVTGDPEAKANFDLALDGMLRLHDLTGTDHFLARSLIRKSTCVLDDCDDPDDGHWYSSPVDEDYWVKRDTSNDEITSHMFMMGPAYDLCADEEQKARIVTHVGNIVGGLMENGWKLIDPVTDEVTTYGNLDPGYVNDHPGGFLGDGGRRSAQMLGALNLAIYLSEDETARDELRAGKRELIEEHHYDTNAIDYERFPAMWSSGDGNELGTQAYWPLVRYEEDPELLALWRQGWDDLYARIKLQQGAYWDISNYVLGGQPEPGVPMLSRWLRLAPVDLIRWTQLNSNRQDLVVPPKWFNQEGRARSDGFIIPYDERRCDRWNTDQYQVDGGHNGMTEMDGADVLMPYWCARYYGLIVPVP